VELLRGNVWDDLLVERFYQPLGLDHVITRAKDAPLFRTAVGHVKIGAGTDEVIPVTTWMPPRSMGPAGLITGSAESLLTFGAAHLRDGLGLTGERIVSAESARLMRTLHTSLSAVSSTQQGWGLGWNLEQWGAETSVSHLGGTIGQVASLHTFHEQQVAIVSLANSRGGDGFNRQMRTLVGSALGLTAPTPRIDGDAADVDLSRLVGTYDSTLTRWQITQDADRRLWIGMTSKNTVLGEPDPEPQLMKPTGRDRFLATVDGAEMEFAYLEYAGKHYLYNLRLYERADASA
jgi:CubicO group peptidase (beta-lactamase class C family)